MNRKIMARLITASAFKRPLELILEEKKLLDQQAVASLRKQSAELGISFEDVLIASSSLPDEVIFPAIAESYGIEFDAVREPVAFSELPERLASICGREKILILEKGDKELVVATSHPSRINSLKPLLAALGFSTSFVVTLPARVEAFLPQREVELPENALYSGISSLASTLKSSDSGIRRNEEKISDISTSLETPSVVELVNKILMLAVNQNASDIHAESTQSGARIRFRIDGVLADRVELDGQTASSFISRLLIMAKLDITEKIMPQDGSFKVTCENKDIEFRIACMPGIYGQNIVLRLLSGAEAVKLELGNIGMLNDELRIITTTTKFPHGMVLVAGPTGSGKSTTLYGVLEAIADPKMKFITIEDPVERRINGVQQIQVRVNRNEPERSLTFARGLRTILRLDPDIILIGEIRDAETAQIAIQASLTGHMVLSTIHANSSVETLRRLENIGIDFHLMMSSLMLVFAQRLLRKLCPECRTMRQAREKEASLLKELRTNTVYEPKGCPACMNMGYRGRTGIFEFLQISDTIRDMVAQKGLTESLHYIRESRLRTLLESALIKVAAGDTDFVELERVCGPCL
ncbi:MAG: hypothetical protein CVV41_17045 [Candidatus Riflebacteria bacterium HGW-Riflebacteria-1]|jgi:type II secretory ATPase GspE/PulE/Tfp pilus assembly ATPase PilB-like protein|nr:MAG: hypothetical protein CVV41_17045 [Candidatus Riflebacteria bacterium HGW-Riflebacteria-1]